jgi:hypothetical protein
MVAGEGEPDFKSDGNGPEKCEGCVDVVQSVNHEWKRHAIVAVMAGWWLVSRMTSWGCWKLRDN